MGVKSYPICTRPLGKDPHDEPKSRVNVEPGELITGVGGGDNKAFLRIFIEMHGAGETQPL